MGIFPHSRTFSNHFQSVAIGQAEIEQNQIRLARCGLRQALLSGDGLLQAISFGVERRAEEAADLGIVFDEENERLHADVIRDSKGSLIRNVAPPPSRARA